VCLRVCVCVCVDVRACVHILNHQLISPSPEVAPERTTVITISIHYLYIGFPLNTPHMSGKANYIFNEIIELRSS